MNKGSGFDSGIIIKYRLFQTRMTTPKNSERKTAEGQQSNVK